MFNMRNSFVDESNTAVVERDVDTGLLVGCVSGFGRPFAGGVSLEPKDNLREVISMLLEDGK